METKQMINLALVDDHTLFREGINLLLDDIPEVRLILEASNGEELLNKLLNHIPEVILLDLDMPIMDGVETCKILKKEHPDIGIIILTMYDDQQMITHLMELGANGYLLKDTNREELETAIKSVYKNQYYFNDFVSKALLSGVKSRKKGHPRIGTSIQLTNRENEVLQLICEELTTLEIAEKLFISARTVEGHRKNLIEKFGVKNTAGLIIKSIKQGFVSIS